MCTLVLLRRPGHDWPLIVGANRDEMRDRPWRPPGRHWADRPEVVAGLDEAGGGSWLGLNDAGVVAGILNRPGTLGPAAGKRSRGELVLDALDHADADAAAAALGVLDARAFRPFNLLVADSRDAFWLKAVGSGRPTVARIATGVAMLTAHGLNDATSARQRGFHARFAGAAAPDPGAGDFAAWEGLLGCDQPAVAGQPDTAMRFATPGGFATSSSALIALPQPGAGRAPVFRFAAVESGKTPRFAALAV